MLVSLSSDTMTTTSPTQYAPEKTRRVMRKPVHPYRSLPPLGATIFDESTMARLESFYASPISAKDIKRRRSSSLPKRRPAGSSSTSTTAAPTPVFSFTPSAASSTTASAQGSPLMSPAMAAIASFSNLTLNSNPPSARTSPTASPSASALQSPSASNSAIPSLSLAALSATPQTVFETKEEPQFFLSDDFNHTLVDSDGEDDADNDPDYEDDSTPHSAHSQKSPSKQRSRSGSFSASSSSSAGSPSSMSTLQQLQLLTSFAQQQQDQSHFDFSHLSPDFGQYYAASTVTVPQRIHRERSPASSSSHSHHADAQALPKRPKIKARNSGVNNYFADGVRKVCGSCGTKSTPYWRDGMNGTCLCNACGIRYKKHKINCSSCFYVPKKEEKSLSACPRCQSGTFQ